MCEVCRQYPCHPRCPNAEEVVIGCCTFCKSEILKGYDYYELPDGELADTDCVEYKYNDDPDIPEVECDCCGKTLKYDEKYYITPPGEKYCSDCIKVIE